MLKLAVCLSIITILMLVILIILRERGAQLLSAGLEIEELWV